MKKIRPGQDMLGNLAPVRLPKGTLGEEPGVTTQEFFRGDGHNEDAR